ncbi:MAG: hypothetical protein PHV34_12610 [Verrucomicrobiae bacterium]|nr:hypothetical protein [Verrucomicrobiae bacterium]
MKAFLSVLFALIFCSTLSAQQDPIPKELKKSFDRYAKAWINRDWGRVFDLTSPGIQKLYLQQFKTRENWIANQENGFKDKLTQFEYRRAFKISETVYTLDIFIKGLRPGGNPFENKDYCSFEWISQKWLLVDPVLPRLPGMQNPQTSIDIPHVN